MEAPLLWTCQPNNIPLHIIRNLVSEYRWKVLRRLQQTMRVGGQCTEYLGSRRTTTIGWFTNAVSMNTKGPTMSP